VLIRTSVESIREMGRSTQGVTLINLDDGTFLASIEKVAESESDESMRANGDVAEEAGGSEADVQVDAPEGETPAADEEGEA
jgi:DNA gyrase subunit A